MFSLIMPSELNFIIIIIAASPYVKPIFGIFLTGAVSKKAGGIDQVMTKKYVGVIAEFTNDGRLLPREVIWDDGRRFGIDRILSARRSAETKTGGVGIRYACLIRGCEKQLFYAENKWFVECAV